MCIDFDEAGDTEVLNPDDSPLPVKKNPHPSLRGLRLLCLRKLRWIP